MQNFFIFGLRLYVLPLTQNLCYCTSRSSLGAAGHYSYRNILGFPTFQKLAGGIESVTTRQHRSSAKILKIL
jgi:hypothetical protein